MAEDVMGMFVLLLFVVVVNLIVVSLNGMQ